MPHTTGLTAFILCSTLAAIPSTNVLAQAPANSAAERARAVHVLNRLSFGPRPGEVDRVLALGVDRWIDRQLRPESIVDSAGLRALDGCPIWTEPVEDALLSVVGRIGTALTMTGNDGVMRQVVRIAVSPTLLLIPRDSALRLRSPDTYLANNQLIACRLARVEFSEQQLLEVMTNFWENHVSVYGRLMPGRGFVVEWDRVVLRPNALGRFRDLLGAVAHSATMINYLDNDVSSVDDRHPSLAEFLRVQGINTVPTYIGRRGLNENYGRELLELHTMGVDAGYTQQDVIEVARAFTGWTQTEVRRKVGPVSARMIVRKPRLVKGQDVDVPGFFFDSTMHDAGPKVVLGHALAPGRGMEDGEEVLDILARHPATARHIARKLAVRFVSDAPPEALIERAAATYLRTNGDIREVLRTIVTSPEFFSPAIYGTKVKTPIELVLSARRALGAAPDTAAQVVDLLIKLDQTPFGHIAPDGWPETGAPWLSAGTMMKRMDLAISIGRGQLQSIPLTSWPAWSMLSNQSFDRQVDGVLQTLLNGQAASGLRKSLLANRPKQAPTTAEQREQSLRELVVLTLGSPAFQRR